MEENFVPYEEALSLKNLGLKNDCFGSWYHRPDIHAEGENELLINNIKYFELPEHQILAPTWDQAFKFISETFNISCEIHKQVPYDGTPLYFWYRIVDVKGVDLGNWEGRYSQLLQEAHQDVEGNFLNVEVFNEILFNSGFAFETREKAELALLREALKFVSLIKKNKSFEYPLRIGKKQKRAILDANGIEIGIFNAGSEEIAQEFCDYLNMKARVNRVEIIGPAGRDFVSRYDSFELTIQDNGRTLKIFKK